MRDRDEQSPFDEKVGSIATVLGEFPPMQVLKAVEQLADDPESQMQIEDVVTSASNVATDEQLKWCIGGGETPTPSDAELDQPDTSIEGGDDVE